MLSLWTGTPMWRAERGPLLIQTLAICLAAQAFRELHFITDVRGARISTELGWRFTHVSASLEGLPASGIAHIWALGKLAALIESTEDGTPVCQLDGDVLLFDPLPAALLASGLLAQSPDIDAHYTGRDMDRGFALAGLPRDCPKYNAGLLGGADIALVRDYAQASLECARHFRGSDLNGTTSSMIVEQAHLGVFARRSRVAVGSLFASPPGQVIHPHYAHLVGAAKRNPQLVSRFGSQLRAQFPAAAAHFDAGWPKVKALFPAAPRRDCGCGCGGSGGCGGSDHYHEHA